MVMVINVPHSILLHALIAVVDVSIASIAFS
jgi:hypothetical protein